MTGQLCLICEEGYLCAREEQIEVEHLGQVGSIKSCYSVCDACGSEQATTAESRLNKRTMIAFKKRTQGLLTGVRVRELRKHWGFSQEQAAKIFGGGPVAFSKYETDDVIQSEAMDKLLRLAAAIPAVRPKLMVDAGVELPRQSCWENVSADRFALKPTQKATHVVSERNFPLEEDRCYA